MAANPGGEGNPADFSHGVDGYRPELTGSPRQRAAGGAEAAEAAAAEQHKAFPGHGGRYVQLGTPKPGGMGLVFQAQDTVLQRVVAIKRILPERVGDAEALSRFRLEAQSQARLWDIPGIVPLLTYDQDSLGPYLVLQWIEGQSLAERQDYRVQVLDWRVAAEYFRQVCGALYQAHQRQLYHRDLKPANILIDRSDRAWVCDFGLVRRGSVQASISPTNSNAFMGTVQFMSPEQERDPRLADARSDIWSLGATLHYLVTGRSAKGMRAERIPAELREVILQATEEEAADRFADMQVFQQALAAVLAPAAPAAVKVVPAESKAAAPAAKAAAPVVKAAAPEAKGEAAKAVSAPQVTAPAAPAAARKAAVAVSGGATPLQAPFDARTAKAAQTAWATALRQPEELVNSVGQRLRLIPPGTFQMGSPNGVGDDDERPQHAVTLTRALWVCVHPVTQGQWQSVMKTTPWQGQSLVKSGSDVAATYVTWNDATEYCRVLSEREGRRYRLLTEAEWEYACRAGTTTQWSFGDDESQLKEYAWYSGNSALHAESVGQKRANAFGLFDMHGNVREWCSDWYGSYGKSAEVDPAGPASGSSRVVRGGGWDDEPSNVRAGYRGHYDPAIRYLHVGFRVCSDS